METFSLERSGANLILHISEELDHHTAGQLSRTIDVLIEKGNVKNIIFDSIENNKIFSTNIYSTAYINKKQPIEYFYFFIKNYKAF